MSYGKTVYHFRHDGINLLEILTSAGSVVKVVHGHTTIDGIGSVVEVQIDGTTYFLHQDGRGTTYEITDINGNVVWQGPTDAWGLPLFESGTNPTIFWYQGQAWWKLTVNGRLFYISPTRIYDTKDGRFVERDPVRSLQYSAYAFPRANPAMTLDATGLSVAVSIPGVSVPTDDPEGVAASVEMLLRPQSHQFALEETGTSVSEAKKWFMGQLQNPPADWPLATVPPKADWIQEVSQKSVTRGGIPYYTISASIIEAAKKLLSIAYAGHTTAKGSACCPETLRFEDVLTKHDWALGEAGAEKLYGAKAKHTYKLTGAGLESCTIRQSVIDFFISPMWPTKRVYDRGTHNPTVILMGPNLPYIRYENLQDWGGQSKSFTEKGAFTEDGDAWNSLETYDFGQALTIGVAWVTESAGGPVLSLSWVLKTVEHGILGLGVRMRSHPHYNAVVVDAQREGAGSGK